MIDYHRCSFINHSKVDASVRAINKDFEEFNAPRMISKLTDKVLSKYGLLIVAGGAYAVATSDIPRKLGLGGYDEKRTDIDENGKVVATYIIGGQLHKYNENKKLFGLVDWGTYTPIKKDGSDLLSS